MSAYEQPGETAQVTALPHVFTPAQAAEMLRSIGLDGITECALRTRAYRKQIPFHLNGRKIIFTITDLREIAEGQAQQPCEMTGAKRPEQATKPRAPYHRRPAATGPDSDDRWRARRPGNG
jgi:hypothetical protein